MARLTRYLLRVFTVEAMAIFGVAIVLVFLAQSMRLFGLVVNRGQNVLTLAGQVALSMPAIMAAVFSICVALGLGRALRTLQGRSELGVIHANNLLAPLLRAVLGFAGLSMVLVLVLTHLVQPLSDRTSTDWSASIAAELVSYRMVPHRFTEIVDGVSLVIGARDSDGNIGDFFADDTRRAERRVSYIARSAILTRDEEGYVLRLRDGAVQYLYPSGQFTQLAFSQYDLPMDMLSEAAPSTDPLARLTSAEILLAGPPDPAAMATLIGRSIEALRVLGLCVLVAALAGFPARNRRGSRVPIEIVVLIAAFVERGLGLVLKGSLFELPLALIGLLGFAGALLVSRLDLLRPLPRRERRA